MEEEKKILLELHDLGVKVVVIEYSGGGDSGQIDDQTAYADEKRETMITNNESIDAVLIMLEDHIYKLLDNIEDWYNNDGGYGHVILQIPSGEYHIDNNIYYTESQNFEHEGFL